MKKLVVILLLGCGGLGLIWANAGFLVAVGVFITLTAHQIEKHTGSDWLG